MHHECGSLNLHLFSFLSLHVQIRYDSLANDVTPTYHIDFDDNYKPTIIRFHAGKPYQDVAYKISDRPWYVNEELGFVNDFDKDTGIYTLHFNLKK